MSFWQEIEKSSIESKNRKLRELNADLLRLIRELLLYAPGDQLRADIKEILARAETLNAGK